MKKPDYKIGDYVEFKYNGYLKKGWVEQVVKLENISSDMFVLKTKSGKTYYVADGIIGDSFKIIRKLPILRDKNGRFCKKDCSCFNCNQCAEQMRAYYEKTGELKAKNRSDLFTSQSIREAGPYTSQKPKLPKNWGKIKDADGNYHEFGEQKPYDEFGSRPNPDDYTFDTTGSAFGTILSEVFRTSFVGETITLEFDDNLEVKIKILKIRK